MNRCCYILAFMAVLFSLSSRGAVLYVDANSTNTTPPFADWSSAAANIQLAVDAATSGDLILVTNGLYNSGGRTGPSDIFNLENQVAVDKRVTVQSVNGPAFTTITGQPYFYYFWPARRCVYLADGATLSGFTLTYATAAVLFGNASGGGAYCDTTNSLITNCIVSGVSASGNGGGIYGGSVVDSVICYNSSGNPGGGVFNAVLTRCLIGTNSSGSNGGGAAGCTLNDCSLVGNSATAGGAAFQSTLSACVLSQNAATADGGAVSQVTLAACALFNNMAADSGGAADQSVLDHCTLAYNTATNAGGGALNSGLTNCIVYFNSAPTNANYSGGSLEACCSLPLPAGANNISAPPVFADNYHLNILSPCIGAGETDTNSIADIDSEAWANPPAIGCDEYVAPVTGGLSLQIQCDLTNIFAGTNVNFTALITGHAATNRWDFGDGTIAANQTVVSHSWATPGDYLVEFRAFNDTLPNGVAATLLIHVSGGVNYVSLASTNPVSPYLTWATAATNIQDAVDVSPRGGTVLVADGTYGQGGRNVGSSLTNRVTVTEQVTVQSVHGPASTIIVGWQVPGTTNDFGAVRGVRLLAGAVLSGFTVTNGATEPDDDGVYDADGGGVNCTSSDSIVTNCIIINNSAAAAGGGVVGGMVLNSIVTGNSAAYGGGIAYNAADNSAINGNQSGGAESCTLTNCTLIENFSGYGGGAANGSTLFNCIAYFNVGSGAPNCTGCAVNYCCTTPMPDLTFNSNNGTNNFTDDPQLTDDTHISATSPCIGAGNTNYSTGTDIDGEPWLNPPSVGCDEFYTGPVSGSLSVSAQANYTNVATGVSVTLSGTVIGRAGYNVWSFGDGTFVTNRLVFPHIWTHGGIYPVTFTAFNDDNPAGVSATVLVRVWDDPVHYVSLTSANPMAPYMTWDTAATNIQDAVDAGIVGGTVLVTNGVYQTGGYPIFAYGFVLTNRVVVTKQLTVRSVNGPAVTAIEGYQAPGDILDDSSARCVYLTNGTALIGFTLTNGATRTSNGEDSRETSGGGVWCDSGGVVSNCVITCCAAVNGGGAEGGTLFDCTLVQNRAWTDAGADSATLDQCTLTGNSTVNFGNFGYGSGGGAGQCTLNNCILAGNSSGYGGGIVFSTAGNCAFYGNTSIGIGGGAGQSTLNNCTLSGNSAVDYAGGADGSTLNNCIVYSNHGTGETNCSGCTLNFSCTTPLPDPSTNSNSGTNDFTAAPQLADNFHLSATSPCIGAGSTNYSSGVDIDGEPWLNPPSVGCDEFHPGAAGDLAVAISADYLAATPGFPITFNARLTGRASTNIWSFGDGTTTSNQVFEVSHTWTTPGTYAVIFTAFNDDHPEGVSATNLIQIAAQPYYFVDASNPNPVAPYLTWATAATNIQDAIDVAIPVTNAIVFVTNGIYSTGARVSPIYGVNNRAVVDKPLTVQGIGGAVVIDGGGVVRCLYISAGAQISGLILTNGSSTNDAGGVWCESGAVVSNCVITGNSAVGDAGGVEGGTIYNSYIIGNSCAVNGGGAHGATLNNCALNHNTANEGGGSDYSTLYNCTVADNAGVNGGGVANGLLGNCIVFYNFATNSGANYYNSTLDFCCTTPLPAAGTNNFTDAPQLSDAAHIAASSPCIGAGSMTYSTGVDIDGEVWLNPPAVGCAEFYPGAATGDLTVSVAVDYPTAATGLALNFSGTISGHATSNLWDFADGATAADSLNVSHTFSAPGDYAVVFTAFNDSHPGGVSATQTVHVVAVPVAYVSLAGTNPVAPYTSWDTAATNIQDAVDVMIPGGMVLVTNGVYQIGGRVVAGIQSNRVVVTLPMTLAAVNGPGVTTIQGTPLSVSYNIGVRCVYLARGAHLTGFTITLGGNTLGDTTQEISGAGIYCEDASSTVENCVITRNSAVGGGGGVWQGTVNRCILMSNTVTCYPDYGSGAGASGCVLNDCLIIGNSANWSGGGATSSTLNNCTVVGNAAAYYRNAIDGCTATNCIVYFNNGGDNSGNSIYDHCCTTPDPGGVGNVTADPLFVNVTNGDYHLQSDSPCINAGINAATVGSTDLDGNPRIFGGVVDLGAYESQLPPSLQVSIQTAYTNVTVGYNLALAGIVLPQQPVQLHWDLGDGTTVDNVTNVIHQWNSIGDYLITLTASESNSDYSVSYSGHVVIHVATNYVYYVNAAGTNPVAPYLTWATAATNIQDAVDAAFPLPVSTVLVTNGTYIYGGGTAPDGGSTAVVVDKPVTVRSVNGPNVTVIGGMSTHRCAYLGDGAVLMGFSITGGSQWYYSTQVGGGVRCGSTNALVTNCIISGNSALSDGGGVYGGTLVGCTIKGNSAANGGGVENAALVNCVLTGNSAASGGAASGSSLTNCTVDNNSVYNANGTGGTYACSAVNCIITDNTQGNYDSSSTMNYCCTMPLPAAGAGNMTNSPVFVDEANGDYHLQGISPCINAGNNADVASATDMDGLPRIFGGTVDMGAYELQALPAWLVSIHTDTTILLVGQNLHLTGVAWPLVTKSVNWNFGDGTSVGTGTNVVHSWAAPGDYSVVFTVFNATYPAGVSATQVVHVISPARAYVSITSTNPVAPFASWATAATNIQAAVDAVADGGMVIVSNGVYQTGGRTYAGSLSNRVVVARPLIVTSVNGPSVTTILGNPQPGDNAIRGVYLAHGASLSGFTVAQGATTIAYNGTEQVNSGGGVYCEDDSAVVEHCIITQNSAIANGGGVMRGTITHTIVSQNSVYYYAFFGWGSGAADCALDNCLVVNNSAFMSGGGAISCTLNNCTVVGNYSYYYPSALDNCSATNCIVQFNNGRDPGNCTYDHCCATSLSGGAGNFPDDPMFLDITNGNFHLQTNSPCIAAGNLTSFIGATDLDGRARVFNGNVDIGAYEFQSADINSLIVWLQRYGLPTDGSADFVDSDGDGMNNWQEWRAGTDPTDPQSVLKMMPAVPVGGTCTLTWQSVAGKNYFVQRASDLSAQPPFTTILDNIAGQDGTTSSTDMTATNSGPYFYRVGVH